MCLCPKLHSLLNRFKRVCLFLKLFAQVSFGQVLKSVSVSEAALPESLLDRYQKVSLSEATQPRSLLDRFSRVHSPSCWDWYSRVCLRPKLHHSLKSLLNRF